MKRLFVPAIEGLCAAMMLHETNMLHVSRDEQARAWNGTHRRGIAPLSAAVGEGVRGLCTVSAFPTNPCCAR